MSPPRNMIILQLSALIASLTATNLAARADGSSDVPSSSVYSECPDKISNPFKISLTDNAIAIDVTGNVLASRVESFTEEDKLTVWVIGERTALDDIKVVRRSEFRDVTVLRIYGQPPKEPPPPQRTLRDTPVEELRCKVVVLTDFSPGHGQFALIGKDEKVLAEFDLAVRPVYAGMFTVGFVGTWLPKRSFSLRDTAGQSRIVEDPSGNVEGRYAVMYTAFLPLQRWRALRDREWNQRIGVSAGVLLDAPVDNFLVGLNAGPVHGISLVAGVHAGKVTELDGVKVGDVLPAGSAIPTKNRWSAAAFIGMNLDVGVATKLFSSLFTSSH